MTVKELINQLSDLPGDSRVLVQGYGGVKTIGHGDAATRGKNWRGRAGEWVRGREGPDAVTHFDHAIGVTQGW